MKNEINETLNTLVLKVLGGVNYASKLATETGKSIPVVFKQLDELVRNNILDKQRFGKRVEYVIKWDIVGSILFDIIKTDLDAISGLIKANKTNNKEIIDLMKEFPESTAKELGKMTVELLQLEQIQEALQILSQELEEAGKTTIKYAKMEFKDSLDCFLDSLGMITDKERKDFIKKFDDKNKDIVDEFLKLCRLHYLLEQESDPRKSTMVKLLEN